MRYYTIIGFQQPLFYGMKKQYSSFAHIKGFYEKGLAKCCIINIYKYNMFRFKRLFSSNHTMLSHKQPSTYPFFSLLFLYLYTNDKYNQTQDEMDRLRLKIEILEKRFL